ncbi:MAG: DUF192 domain-containing protein [Candidatus Woesearchaeota archaeon]
MKLSDMVDTIVVRKTPFEKASGLMFKKNIKHTNTAYLFSFDQEKKIPIHMLFVFFSIDVLWLNKDFEVIDLKKNVAPFMPHIGHKGKAQYLVELPQGTIAKQGISLMDVVKVS